MVFANLCLDFNVTEYSGTKSILISTRTALGGKNPFMGIAYVVVGGVCVLLGALFTVAHLIRPRYDILNPTSSPHKLNVDVENLATTPILLGTQINPVLASPRDGMTDMGPVDPSSVSLRFPFLSSLSPVVLLSFARCK